MSELIKIIIFIIVSAVSNSSFSAELKYYTDNQYPYNRLIARADSIKIIYSERKQIVQCKVSVNWQEHHQQSTKISINKKQFNEAPLTHCLPRALAKSILAKTYN